MFDFPASPTEGQMFAPVGGPLYVYNNPVWKVAGITTIPGEWVINERIVLASETYSKPANLAYLEVWEQAGGGGGGASAAGVAAEITQGTGGGGGGAVYSLFDAADVPASVAITIPAAALPAAAGGTILFGALLSATGGAAGGAGTGSGATPATVRSALGGVGSGGDLNLTGGVGTPVIRMNSGHGTAGGGGAAPFGSSGAPQIVSTSGAGVAGTVGDGGGGGMRVGTGAALAGGAGGIPFIRLREYFPAWVLDVASQGTVRYDMPQTLTAGEKAQAQQNVGLSYKGARVSRSTDQSLPNAAVTAIVWGVEDEDVGNWWASGAPTLFTVPAGVTRVRATGCGAFGSNVTGFRQILIYKNGAALVPGVGAIVATAGTVSAIVDTGWLPVVAGDTFDLRLYQNSTIALAALASLCWFAIEAYPGQ